MPDQPQISGDEEPAEATLTFREQADGRKVARLPGGKVVLVTLAEIDRVKDGERWRVRLRHRDTFSIAEPLERERQPVMNPLPIADALATARAIARPAVTVALHMPVVVPAPTAAPLDPAAPGSRVTSPLPVAAPAPAPATVPVEAPISTPPVSAAVDSRTDVAPAVRRAATTIMPSRVVGMADRVAMFVDGANMDLACRMAGYFVDYKKARQLFLASGLFYAAYYYIADYTSQDPLQQKYLDFLAHADYIVRRKAVKVMRDHETGERVLKANVDTELVLDLVNTADNYDLAFLFSGDSDFERAVDLLRSRGKRIYVVTSNKIISRELVYVADKPIFFIEDFRAQLEREDRKMAPRNAT